MQKLTRRAMRVTAAVGSLATALILLPAAPASAAPGDANSSAYALKVNVLAGTINVGPLATHTCPPTPGGTTSVVSASLGALGSARVLNGSATCDTSGVSSATGSAANVALLGGVVTSLPAITATLISATCSANGSPPPLGSSTFVGATLGTTAIVANPAPNTTILNVPSVIQVILNEQTLAGGVLTVNALHVIVGPGGILGDIIIGHAVCGPNTPVVGVPIFTNIFYVGLGAIAIVALGGYLVRRRVLAQRA
jgi:hypothetical protein